MKKKNKSSQEKWREGKKNQTLKEQYEDIKDTEVKECQQQ